MDFLAPVTLAQKFFYPYLLERGKHAHKNQLQTIGARVFDRKISPN